MRFALESFEHFASTASVALGKAAALLNDMSFIFSFCFFIKFTFTFSKIKFFLP